MGRTGGVTFEQSAGGQPSHGSGNAAGRPIAAPARLPRQRRNGMLALAVLLVGLGALLATYVVASMSERVSAVILLRDVAVGTPLAAADVGTTMVSVDNNVAIVPGGQIREVTGRFAATALKKGSLLTAAQLTGAASPGSGQQVVPVALTASQIPARGLAPGDQVLVVETQGSQSAPQTATRAGQGGDSPAGQGEVQGIVDRVGNPDADGRVVVDLLLAAQAGPAVARQAAAGRVALVLTPRRP